MVAANASQGLSFQFSGYEGSFALFAMFPVAALVLGSIIHIVLAVSVYRMAEGKRTELLPWILWVLATLLTGLLAAVAYWLVHESALSTKKSE